MISKADAVHRAEYAFTGKVGKNPVEAVIGQLHRPADRVVRGKQRHGQVRAADQERVRAFHKKLVLFDIGKILTVPFPVIGRKRKGQRRGLLQGKRLREAIGKRKRMCGGAVRQGCRVQAQGVCSAADKVLRKRTDFDTVQSFVQRNAGQYVPVGKINQLRPVRQV